MSTSTRTDYWKSNLGVMLAVAGSAIGFGNFLRFPGLAAQYGGGAFVVAYFCCFLLLGLPLAIRTSRRETSIGLFLSVILAGGFFFSIILCEALADNPKIYPQYLIWLPNIIFQTLGAVMTIMISRK